MEIIIGVCKASTQPQKIHVVQKTIKMHLGDFFCNLYISVLPTVVGSGRGRPPLWTSRPPLYSERPVCSSIFQAILPKLQCWSSVDQWLGMLLCTLMVPSSNPPSVRFFFFFVRPPLWSTLGRTLIHVQWNLSIAVTQGPKVPGLNKEVAEISWTLHSVDVKM